MKPRVCIFASESLLHWTAYYVRAFRKQAEVMVIGPRFEPENHDYPDWDAVAGNLVENDIISDSPDAIARLQLLPEGWDPQLLVVIQSADVRIRGLGRVGCPTVRLSVDSWHDPSEFEYAYQYDFVFLAQKALMKYMRRTGCCRVFWLPLGCDPEHHYPPPANTPAYDIAFVGSTHFTVNRQRRARLERLQEHVRVAAQFGLGPEATAALYGQSALVFNASISRDVNMRVFEVLATGKPLVTNREASDNGLFDLFEDGVHLITYDDDDLLTQVRYYLAHPEEARAIGERGRQAVLAGHTYNHRVDDLFEQLRSHGIDLDGRACPCIRAGQTARDFLPHGAARVLDVGLGLAASKIALRRSGVTFVAGIAPDADSQERRANSYDVIWRFEELPDPTGDFDTVVCVSGSGSGLHLDGLLNFARRWLLEGGRVLLGVDEGEIRAVIGDAAFEPMDAWFATRGFRLRAWRPPSDAQSTHLLLLAARSATLDEINTELYREFPVNGYITEPWNMLTDEGAPG